MITAPPRVRFSRSADRDGPWRGRQGDAPARRGPDRARTSRPAAGRFLTRRTWPSTPARHCDHRGQLRGPAPAFPGGSIGDLAVNGTVNDLAVAGARADGPGCDIRAGGRVADTSARGRSARDGRRGPRARGCAIVGGDTKVVEHGQVRTGCTSRPPASASSCRTCR